MSEYYNSSTGEIRNIDQKLFDHWKATANPKAIGFVPLVKQPKPDGVSTMQVSVSNGLATLNWIVDHEATVIKAEHEAKLVAHQQSIELDREALVQLEKFSATFEAKEASPELIQEAVRLLLRDALRRYNINTGPVIGK